MLEDGVIMDGFFNDLITLKLLDKDSIVYTYTYFSNSSQWMPDFKTINSFYLI